MEAASGGTAPDRQADPKGTARQRLLDAAEHLFSEHGFTATTTRSITELAGTSTGTVFYHFKSKEALLLALLRERSPHHEIVEILGRHEDPREGLLELAVSIQRMARERSAMVRLVLRGDGPVPEQMDMLERRLADGIDRVASFLVDRVPALDQRRATTMAQMFVTTLVLGEALMPSPMGHVHPDVLVDILLKGFLDDPGPTDGPSNGDEERP